MIPTGTRSTMGFVEQGRLRNTPHTARYDQTTLDLD